MLPAMSARQGKQRRKRRDCLEAAEMPEKAGDGIHQDEQRRNGRSNETLPHFKSSNKGLRNMPPPTPVSPDNSPSSAPKNRATDTDGWRISLSTCSV